MLTKSRQFNSITLESLKLRFFASTSKQTKEVHFCLKIAFFRPSGPSFWSENCKVAAFFQHFAILLLFTIFAPTLKILMTSKNIKQDAQLFVSVSAEKDYFWSPCVCC